MTHGPRDPHYTIYSHADADGAVAALLLREHLKRTYGDSLRVTISPVDYGRRAPDHLNWFDTPLQLPCAVLDFGLHPSLLLPRTFAAAHHESSNDQPPCYWIDHHLTGGQFPFLTPENAREVLPRPLVVLWDPESLSTPGLMRTHRHSLGLREDVLQDYELLIDTSEIIDGALYQSAALAHDFDSLAVRLAMLFGSRHPGLDEHRFYVRLIDHLAEHGVRNPAYALDADPLYDAVLQYERSELIQKRRGYEAVGRVTGGTRSHPSSPGMRCAVFDFRKSPEQWRGLARFMPFELFPESHFALHVSPPDARGLCVITCGQNPWNRPHQTLTGGALTLPGGALNLGTYFSQHFHGGGHAQVAGGVVAPDEHAAIETLLQILGAAD